MLWAGSLLVFLTVALVLAVTWKYLGQPARLAVGVACGLGMMGLGETARSKMERGFGEGLCGGGLAVLYLNAWTATARYHLISFETALPLMVLVTVIGVTMAIRYDCMSLHALATIGGFLTPALAPQSGAGVPVPFLTYVAVLNAGIVAVALFKAWRPIVWLSLAATVCMLGAWADTGYHVSDRWIVFSYVTVYFLLYSVAAAFRGIVRREKSGDSDVLLLVTTALAYFGAGYVITHGALGHFPGVFPLAVCAFFGAAAMTAPRADAWLRQAAGALCALFLTLAVPIQLRQGWVAAGWSLEAAVLLSLAALSGGRIVQRSGQIVWGLSLVAVLGTLMDVEATTRLLFLNERGLPVLAAVLTSAWVAAFEKAKSAKDDLRPAYLAAAVLGGAWLVGQEIAFGLRHSLLWWPSGWRAAQTPPYAVSMALSAFGAAAYALGLRLREQTVRICAIAVAAVGGAMPMALSGMGGAPEWTPFWSPRALAFAFGIAGLGAIAWLASRESDDMNEDEADGTRLLPLGIHGVALWGLTCETLMAFAPGDSANRMALAWLCICFLWSAYAAGLVLLGWINKQFELRALGYAVAAAALVALLGANSSLSAHLAPAINLRFLAFAGLVACLSFIAWLGRAYSGDRSADEVAVSDTAAAAAVAIAFWGLTRETYAAFEYYQVALGPNWTLWAQSAVSLVWTAFASALLVTGIMRGKKAVRMAGLALFFVSLAKVLVFDLAFLETQYRILSTGVLGVALIGMSWLYTRFGIGRDDDGSSSQPGHA
jgi:uncharacterized membrane protein